MGWEGMDRLHLAGLREHGNEISGNLLIAG